MRDGGLGNGARGRRMLLALAVLVVGLAGCSSAGDGDAEGEGTGGGDAGDAGPPGSSPSNPPVRDCDVNAPLPVAPTWAAHGGAWSQFLEPTPLQPVGTRGAGAAAGPGLSLLVDHATAAAGSLDLSVDLAIVSGEHPDGAGIVFHWTGPDYNIVRFSPSEAGWHVFTVLGDNRTKLNATAQVAAPPGPEFCEWTSLRVVVRGAAVEVFQDGSPVLHATLPSEASLSGQSGLFLRGGTVALFSAYTVTPG